MEHGECSKRIIRLVLIATSIILVIIILMTVGIWLWARPGTPTVFYNKPEKLPSEHGVLIRKKEFVKDIPENARAWKILYSTTDIHNNPAVASALVVIPDRSENSKSIIAYAHGTIGVAPGCAPSLVKEQFPNGGARSLLESAINNNWIFVSSDYTGLGTSGPHPFLIGDGEGKSVLDAIKAAEELEEVNDNSRVIIWGHSQGGHAALWSGIIAPYYTPDLKILGIAALSPASDLIGLIQSQQSTPMGKIMVAFVVTSFSQIYQDVKFNEIIKDSAQFLARDIAGRCLSGKETIVSIIEASRLLKGSILATDFKESNFGKRLAENLPNQFIPFPLFISQGMSDDLVPLRIQDEFVQGRCAAGQDLEYRRYEDRGHIDVLSNDSKLIPDLISWTQDRLLQNPYERWV